MDSKQSTKRIPFTKMSGAGNDFVVIDNTGRTMALDWPAFAIRYCAPKTGIGADGLIVLEPDTETDFTLCIFNADGSEAEMCGNGARCAALFAFQQRIAGKSMLFKTLAGIISARIKDKDVAIQMTDPFDLKTNISTDVGSARMTLHFINTGVPHTIVFTERLDEEPVSVIGRAIRHHSLFAPAGTNVDFVQIISKDAIRVRTFERGVEAETYACGTGAVASAIISHRLGTVSGTQVFVHMRGGELRIGFTLEKGVYTGVWLAGPVDRVFTGQITARS